MPPSGNFGAVSLEGDHVRAIGNSVEQDGFESVSLSIAIVQNGTVVPGVAQVSSGSWTTDPPLSADKLGEGRALGLASQTLFAKGPPPTFVTFTWSEELDITRTQ